MAATRGAARTMTKAICENAVHRVFVRFSELTRTGALSAFEVVQQANRHRSRERGSFHGDGGGDRMQDGGAGLAVRDQLRAVDATAASGCAGAVSGFSDRGPPG